MISNVPLSRQTFLIGMRRSPARVVLAVSLVCTAELVLELVEYPLLYADHFHYDAYYDTLADMANSIVGAVVGAALAIPLRRRFPRA